MKFEIDNIFFLILGAFMINDDVVVVVVSILIKLPNCSPSHFFWAAPPVAFTAALVDLPCTSDLSTA